MFDRVLLQKLQPVQKTAGGIVLPDSAQSKLNAFKVVEVGAGARSSTGDVIKPRVNKGDTVLLSEGFGGEEIQLQGETYHLYRETDILGILHE